MDSGRVIDLITSVFAPRNPFIINPAIITLISDIPEPAAYGAKALTSTAAEDANKI
jgi:hypothetical protein